MDDKSEGYYYMPRVETIQIIDENGKRMTMRNQSDVRVSITNGGARMKIHVNKDTEVEVDNVKRGGNG